MNQLYLDIQIKSDCDSESVLIGLQNRIRPFFCLIFTGLVGTHGSLTPTFMTILTNTKGNVGIEMYSHFGSQNVFS